MVARGEIVPAYLIHWNAPEWCASSARSILASEGATIDLTVVDNGQHRGPAVEELIPQGVRVLRTDANLGFTGAANLALEDWRRRLPRSELCLIGSHDLHVRRDTVRQLMGAATANKAYGVLAPTLLSPFQSSGGYWTGWKGGQLSIDDVRGVVERNWVSGTCMLLRAECADSVGGFDANFGSYVEDVDFGLRAGDAGWKVGVVADAIAWGLGSASTNPEPAMVANRVLLVAKRSGRVKATLRGVTSFGSLGLRAAGSVVAALLLGKDAKGRPKLRSRFGVHASAMRRILAIIRKVWRGRIPSGPTHPKTYTEVEGGARMSAVGDGLPTFPEIAPRLDGPVASVVITTGNRPVSPSRAVASALGQTIADIEVVVVVDGSDESSGEIAHDHRVREIRSEGPSGVGAARNAGLRAARGGWVTFLDHEDELVPHMLEMSLRAMAESRLPRPVAALSGMELVDSAGRVVEIRVPMTMPRGTHFPPDDAGGEFRPTNTLVVPVEILLAVGGWDEHKAASAHDDLFFRLGAVCSIQAVHDLTYRKNARGGDPSIADDLGRAEGIARTLRKHSGIFATNRQVRARLLGEMGKSYIKAGRWWPAVEATTRSFLDDPQRPKAFRQWMGSLAGPRAWSWYVRMKRAPAAHARETQRA